MEYLKTKGRPRVMCFFEMLLLASSLLVSFAYHHPSQCLYYAYQ